MGSPKAESKDSLPHSGLAPTIVAAFGVNRRKGDELTHLSPFIIITPSATDTLLPLFWSPQSLGKAEVQKHTSKRKCYSFQQSFFSSFLQPFFITIIMSAKLTVSTPISSRQLICSHLLTLLSIGAISLTVAVYKDSRTCGTFHFIRRNLIVKSG